MLPIVPFTTLNALLDMSRAHLYENKSIQIKSTQICKIGLRISINTTQVTQFAIFAQNKISSLGQWMDELRRLGVLMLQNSGKKVTKINGCIIGKSELGWFFFSFAARIKRITSKVVLGSSIEQLITNSYSCESLFGCRVLYPIELDPDYQDSSYRDNLIGFNSDFYDFLKASLQADFPVTQMKARWLISGEQDIRFFDRDYIFQSIPDRESLLEMIPGFILGGDESKIDFLHLEMRDIEIHLFLKSTSNTYVWIRYMKTYPKTHIINHATIPLDAEGLLSTFANKRCRTELGFLQKDAFLKPASSAQQIENENDCNERVGDCG